MQAQPQFGDRLSRLEEWRDSHAAEFEREREASTKRSADLDGRLRSLELQIAKATGVIIAVQVVLGVVLKLWH